MIRFLFSLRTNGCVVFAVCGLATSVWAGLDQAVSAMYSGDYETAYKEFKVLADGGDDKAMVTIGTWFQEGEGFPIDYASAMDWYLKALDLKNADACNNIGVMYRDGLGVPQDLVVAYALFSASMDMAENDDTLGRAARNLEKANTWISSEQLDQAKKLPKNALSADSLRQLNSAQKKSRGFDLEAFHSKYWEALPSTYTFDSAESAVAYAGTTVSLIREDVYDEMEGTLGFSFKDLPGDLAFVSNGVFTYRPTGYSLSVPQLSGGEVEIHVSTIRKGTYQIRFFEHGVSSIEPWVGFEPLHWHAAVVSTTLPDEWRGQDAEVLAEMKRMAQGWLADLPPSIWRISELNGSSGVAIQFVVLNQIPSPLYPQTIPKLSPFRDGIARIGVNRLMHVDNSVVQLGLIVANPDNLAGDELIRHAAKQMDLFAGGIDLIAKPHSP